VCRGVNLTLYAPRRPGNRLYYPASPFFSQLTYVELGPCSCIAMTQKASNADERDWPA
jgi:hypothetical protein